MGLRTDLLLENEAFKENKETAAIKRHRFKNCELLEAEIKDKKTAEQLGKPIGKYFTVYFNELSFMPDISGIKKALHFALDRLIPKADRDNIMIIGLGNTDITPDALGPFCADKVLATRHIEESLKNDLGLQKLKSVSVLIPGVIGKTGIEALETIRAAAEKVRPTAIIAIDALAAASTKNLCSTIQLSSSGITPGSGVKNKRKELSYATLGIPVIAIGMPTVTDTIEAENKTSHHIDMMVTPKDIDILIRKSAELIGDSLNCFLQPDINPDILAALT